VSSKWLQAASIEQWRAAMTTASMLPSILPMVTKQYLVAQKMQEFNVRSATIYMRSLRAGLESTSKTIGTNYLRDLRVGTLDRTLPAAPSQLVVETDLASLDAWANFITVLEKPYKEDNVIPLGNVVYDAMGVFRLTMNAFTTYARRSAHSIEDLEPELLEKTGVPMVYIEQMAMEAAMLSLWQGSPDNLTMSINKFEIAVRELRSDSRTTSERCRVQAVSRLLDAWGGFKPKVEKFGIKFTYDEKQLREMMNGTEALSNAAEYMQSMFEAVNPTCVLNDSGGFRSLTGLSTLLCGFLVLLRTLR
jgi:hypothetical protein